MCRSLSVVLSVLALLTATHHTASAQRLSATLAYSRNAYGGGDYVDTNGDWQADATVRYRLTGPLRLGAGASVGKLDEPYSDASLTSIAAFLEPSVASRWDRIGARVGVRYGWAHERVGVRDNGLWAWGWEAGAVGGVEYAVSTLLSVGLQAEATRLDLGRDQDHATVLGLEREGWRYAIGGAVTVGSR